MFSASVQSVPATGLATPGWWQSLLSIFANQAVDGWTMATPLDIVGSNAGQTLAELWRSHPQLQGVSGPGWWQTNVAFLAGGLYLIKVRMAKWQAPVAMLAALFCMALLFCNGTGSHSHGSPLFHLFSGATMMGAFFIVTDPVSGAVGRRGRFVFGAGVGVLTYIIRAWGGYPDGIAFATLLMNMAVPLIDTLAPQQSRVPPLPPATDNNPTP